MRRRTQSGHEFAEEAADSPRKKDLKELVATFDKLVRPLDEILRLLKNASTAGVILIIFMAVTVAAQVHTTLRMVAVEERLNSVIDSEKTLTAAATAQEQQQATQAQISIEPAVTPSGAPTAIIVVSPPKIVGSSSAKVVRPVPLALAPTTTSTVPIDASVPKPSSHGSASASAPPAPAPPAALTVKFE
jgi:hypothetical protein